MSQMQGNTTGAVAAHGVRVLLCLAVAAAVCWPVAAGAIEWSLRNVFQPKIGSAPDKKPTAGKTQADTEKPVIFWIQAVKLGKVSRLELSATRPIKADAFVLADPSRAVVDLNGALVHLQQAGAVESKKDADVGSRSAGLIKSFRFGMLTRDSVRVVIDLQGPAKIAQISQIRIAPNVHRLRIDLGATGLEDFQALARAGLRSAAARVAKANALAPPVSVKGSKPVIAIDPGHGGVDGGTLAAGDTPEKDIVFAFSKELAKQLRASGRFTVVLTRNGDVFVPLWERVEIARRAKAQLLISIHADSLNEKSVQGATVYTVSERASDAHTARLAEKENQADARAGYQGPKTQAEVSDILFDLTRRETRAFSHLFSQALIGHWEKAAKLNKNPHRSGRFVVLKAPDVPSVLLELGYLSSKADAKLLSDPKWRGKAAGSVAAAVTEFFDRKGRAEQAGAPAAPGAPQLAKRDGAH